MTHEQLQAEHGPLSEQDHREFTEWNRGNPGDTIVAFRYWLLGMKTTGGLAKTWREISQCEIVLYPLGL